MAKRSPILPFAVVAVLWVLAPLAARGAADDPFRDRLAKLAAGEPQAVFLRDERTPAAFARWLEGKSSGAPLTNLRARDLYEEFLAQPGSPGVAAPKGRPAESLPLERAGALDADGARGGSLFDGAAARQSGAPQARRRRRGIRVHGLEFKSGTEQDHRKGGILGEEDPFPNGQYEWDLRLRLRGDSVGFKLEHFDKFNVAFRRYVDVPALAGLGDARDDVYGLVGEEPLRHLRGYQFSVGSQINSRWDVSYTRTDRSQVSGEEFASYRDHAVWVSYSPPRADASGKWSHRLFGGVHYAEISNDDLSNPDPMRSRSGFGYTAGVAFRRALDGLPVPFFKKRDGVGMDYWVGRLMIADSPVAEFRIKAAAELAIFVGKHILFTPGIYGEYYPGGRKTGFGLSTQLSFRF